MALIISNRDPYSPICLAIDTSTSNCSVAVGDSYGKIFTHQSITERRHNEILASLVIASLRDALLNWRDLNALFISIGPGSFTGLRVGVSFAKGVALALELPLLGVSSLKILAETYSSSFPGESEFMALIPARRGESFGQLHKQFKGRLKELTVPRLIDRDDAIRAAASGVILVGEGARQFQEDVQVSCPTARIAPEIAPSPSELIRIGREVLSTKSVHPVSLDLEPFYLKEFTVKAFDSTDRQRRKS